MWIESLSTWGTQTHIQYQCFYIWCKNQVNAGLKSDVTMHAALCSCKTMVPLESNIGCFLNANELLVTECQMIFIPALLTYIYTGEGASCYLHNHLFSNRIHHCSYIQSRLIVFFWLWWLVTCAVLCINLLLLSLHTGSSWIPSMPWQGKDSPVPKTLQVHASSSSLCFATDINVD